MSDRFTEKQGQYLAFIDSYMVMHGRAPAEAAMTVQAIENSLIIFNCMFQSCSS